MKRKTITLLIIITSLVLIGVIVTQYIWIDNAVKLRKVQFRSKVQIGLKSVVNQIFDFQNDSVLSSHSGCRRMCQLDRLQIVDAINPLILDSLIRSEFAVLLIETPFKYAILNNCSQKIQMGDYKGYERNLITSAHKVSVSCLYKSSDDHVLAVYFPKEREFLIQKMSFMLLLTGLFLLVFVSLFGILIYSFYRQKRLSEMKTDFVNNMTHEFKTPVSTISLASEMLMKQEVVSSADRVLKYAGIIYDENIKLKQQIDQVLQAALIDRGEFRIRKESCNPARLAADVADSFQMAVTGKGGTLQLQIEENIPDILADQMHLTNVVSNLVDNAIKYSQEAPEIMVGVKNYDAGVIISVTDRGIGISKENQKLIFKQFHRVGSGDLHDVKGFGLGLYYVKTIVEAHEGIINVQSEPGKGSRFEVYLPVHSKDNVQ